MKKYLILATLTIFAITSPWHVLKQTETFEGKQVTTGIAVGMYEAFARTEETDVCRTAFQAVLDGAPAKGTYEHAILDHLHDQLYRFNKIELADVEMMFCRITSVMGFSPDLTSLPQSVTKTDPEGATVTIDITAPTEDFATGFGYTYKGDFQNDNKSFMKVWWAGKDDTSKGYLIQGDNPMQEDNNTRLKYVYWDLSSTKQVVKVWATQFNTSYLSSLDGPSASKNGGDHAMFARLNFNSSDNSTTAQNIEIGQDKDNASKWSCVRTYFTGTLGGTILGYRPAQGIAEYDNETSTGGEGVVYGNMGLDGESGLVDSKTTADKSGTALVGSNLDNGTFDFSCNDLKIAGVAGGGKAFDNNTIDYTQLPNILFPASN